MYEKLVALLVAKFAQARKDGLQQLARSLALQVADETEAQALVDKLSAEKVTDFIKEWRKEVDSEITKGTKSYEENLKSKYDFIEKKTPTSADPNDVATLIANAVKQAVEPLQVEIQSLKLGKTADTRKQTLENALKDVPHALKSSVIKNFDKMNFESDEDFNTFLSEMQNDLKQAHQEAVNSGLGRFPRPASPSNQTDKEQIKNEIAQWASQDKEANK